MGVRGGVGTHQLFELSLSVAELLVHAEPHLGALQGGDDLQLGVFIFNDVVLQHQTQDLETCHAQVKAADILKHQNMRWNQHVVQPSVGKWIFYS